MQIVMDLTIAFDVTRGKVTVTTATVKGASQIGSGDAEVELVRRLGESSEPSEEGGAASESPPPTAWALTPEGAAVAAAAAAKPAGMGNLMNGSSVVPKAPQNRADGLLTDLLTLGISPDDAANCIKTYSMERLKKLLGWVRGVQAKEGCSAPGSLFLRCLAKGVK